MSEVKERPILFSAPMILALLAGTKTQTRRIVKATPGAQAKWLTPELLRSVPSVEVGKWDCGFGVSLAHPKGGPLGFVSCPYGAPGDHLWVKESIRCVGQPQGEDRWCDSEFIADGARTLADCWPWKNKALPSIHMPKGLSRLSLEVTGVRVERLQEISASDAIREGIERAESTIPTVSPGWRDYESGGSTSGPVASYRSLWESINGDGSWALNPWVWVVEFKRAT